MRPSIDSTTCPSVQRVSSTRSLRYTVMRRLMILLFALGVGGCGHRSIIEFSDADAKRLPDGHVTASTVAVCEPMMGHSECGALCVTATWIERPGGGTIDSVTRCDPKILHTFDRAPFTLTSSTPIPTTTSSEIILTATSSYRGPWQVYPKTLPSP